MRSEPPLGISELRNCDVRAVLQTEVKIKNCFLELLKENFLRIFSSLVNTLENTVRW